MLGDQIGDRTRQGDRMPKCFDPKRRGPGIEATFEAAGEILGVESFDNGHCTPRPCGQNGTVYGEGQGVVKGANGQMASWVGQGIGELGAEKRSVIAARSTTRARRRSGRVSNGVAAIYDYEVDEQGNSDAKMWEWK